MYAYTCVSTSMYICKYACMCVYECMYVCVYVLDFMRLFIQCCLRQLQVLLKIILFNSVTIHRPNAYITES